MNVSFIFPFYSINIIFKILAIICFMMNPMKATSQTIKLAFIPQLLLKLVTLQTSRQL